MGEGGNPKTLARRLCRNVKPFSCGRLACTYIERERIHLLEIIFFNFLIFFKEDKSGLSIDFGETSGVRRDVYLFPPKQ